MEEEHSPVGNDAFNPPASPYPPTRTKWLEAFQQGGSTAKQIALGEIYEFYREPIMWLLRRKGVYDLSKAEDLIQGFFLYTLEKEPFKKMDKSRGRFRTLLLTALNHYAMNEHRRSRAAIRFPAGGMSSLDQMAEEDNPVEVVGDAVPPDKEFEKKWAAKFIRRVLMSLETECKAKGQATYYEIFYRCKVARSLDGTQAPPLEQLAKEYGLNAKDVSNRLITVKRAYKLRLKIEINLERSAYELPPYSEAELAEEIQDLFTAFGR